MRRSTNKINHFWKQQHQPEQQVRRCDHPDCNELAEHKAPRSRSTLNEYYWFCLKHVQEYNKCWNYYAGLTEEEILAKNREDLTWGRPTWPMGARVEQKLRDRLAAEFMRQGYGEHASRARGEGADPEQQKRKSKFMTPEQKALEKLQMEPTLDFDKIKARYRELAKRYHPDHNNGDKAAEEKLKEINQAYEVLEKAFKDV